MFNTIDEETRKQLQQFEEQLVDLFGDVIRKPIFAKLGYQDENGTKFIKVPEADTDLPRQYYFRESGGQSFVGQAYLQDGALEKWQIKYNAPIRVRKDPLTGDWEIIGIDARYASEFFENPDSNNFEYVDIDQINASLLRETNPVSMKVILSPTAWTYDVRWKYTGVLTTADFSQSPQSAQIPTDPSKVRYALVQFNFDAVSLSYKYGKLISSSLSHEQAYEIQLSSGIQDIFLPPDVGYFRCGYIRLNNGMTAITNTKHIWSVQEFVTKTHYTDILTASGEVVTCNGEVVTRSNIVT